MKPAVFLPGLDADGAWLVPARLNMELAPETGETA